LRRIVIAALLIGLGLIASPAAAQFDGSHTLGDFGVQSGTQPAPGLYVAAFFYRYDTDTVKNNVGDVVRFPAAANSPSSVGVNAFAPIIWYVSKTKIAGANVGAFAVIPFANMAIDAPIFGLNQSTGAGLSDTLIRPLDLGWHTPRADVITGFQFYAPTGSYQFGGSENNGRGMWTSEPFVGTTVHLDAKRTVSLATTAYWEIHGKKRDTDIKVGQILTLEGGAGKSYAGGGVVVGAAYYAQWKLTADNLGFSAQLPGGGLFVPELNKHRTFALGPDVTLPVVARDKSKLFALVNIRYFWEMGVRTKTQGQTLVITGTFPVPSVKLK